MKDVLDKSLVFGYNMAKDDENLKMALEYARRTFVTNI
jgi:hypothetical protein